MNPEMVSSPARPQPHIFPAKINLVLKAFECLEGSQKASSLLAQYKFVQDRDSFVHIPLFNTRSSFTVSGELQTLQLARLETDASRLSRSISRSPFISHRESELQAPWLDSPVEVDGRDSASFFPEAVASETGEDASPLPETTSASVFALVQNPDLFLRRLLRCFWNFASEDIQKRFNRNLASTEI